MAVGNTAVTESLHYTCASYFLNTRNYSLSLDIVFSYRVLVGSIPSEMFGTYAHPEQEEDSTSGTFSLASLANIKHEKKLGKTKNQVRDTQFYIFITQG